jgi:tryptophan-rich sensory protein
MSIVLNIFRFCLPAGIGFLTGALCPLRNAGSSIPARPPGYVFGIMWTLLYILVGLAWIYASRIHWMYDVAFLALSLLLASWTVVYGCGNGKKAALYILLLNLLAATMITISLVLHGCFWALSLVPLVIWLIFATMLNYTEVNALLKCHERK